MKWKTLFFALAMLGIVFGCSNLGEEIEDDVTTSYTFFDTNPDDTPDAQTTTRTYKIGEEIKSEKFPQTSDFPFNVMKQGYHIEGWKYYKNPADDSRSIPETMDVGDGGLVNALVVTPQPAQFYVSQWLQNTYYVAFDANGGSGAIDTMAVKYDEEATLPPNTFERVGYIFTRWNTDKDGAGVPYEDGATIFNLTDTDGETITLYAQWFLEHINIIFAPGEGSGKMPMLENASIGDTLPSNTFTCAHHHFIGWLFESSTGRMILYGDGDTLNEYNWPNESPATLTAQWDLDTYPLQLYKNDTTDGGDESYVQNFPYGVATPIETPFTRIGYDQTGWSKLAVISDPTSPEFALGASLTLYEEPNYTLKAQWKAQERTIKFDANGGTSGTMADQILNYKDGKTLNASVFTRAGYDFAGWSFTPTGTGEIADKATLDDATWTLLSESGTTLYAVWTPHTLTVTFYPGYWSFSTSTQKIKYDELPATLKTAAECGFTATGYEFDGWTTSVINTLTGGSKEYDDAAQINESNWNGDTKTLSLRARWKAQTMNISYNANGGSGTMTYESVSYNQLPKILTQNSFTKTGCKFMGWGIGSSSTSVSIADKGQINESNWTSVYNAGGYLNAIWQARFTLGTATQTTATVTQGTLGEESVTLSTTDSGTNITNTWYIDDNVKGTGTTLTIDYSSYPGTHTVTLVCLKVEGSKIDVKQYTNTFTVVN